ncbi:hypothetical protein D3C75_776110 [compost metagenome]
MYTRFLGASFTRSLTFWMSLLMESATFLLWACIFMILPYSSTRSMACSKLLGLMANTFTPRLRRASTGFLLRDEDANTTSGFNASTDSTLVVKSPTCAIFLASAG